MQVDTFLAKYGLLAAYTGSVFEGDTVMLIAGGLSRYGLLSWVGVWAAGIAGAATADIACYWLGRLGQRSSVAGRFRKLARAIDKYGLWEIPLARLVPGTRVASMVFWGSRGLHFNTFLLLDLLGCTLWAGLFAGCGWFLAVQVETLLPALHRFEHRLMTLAIVAATSLVVARYVLRRRRRLGSPTASRLQG
ncbi:Inner membrane protein YohD [bacterium HR30]|nr:Inner membrane protein YohD [bacterium HR30]